MARVCVAIPLYNKFPFLREALESVRAQTYRDLRILIVDDASTDGSARLLREHLDRISDPRVTFVQNPSNLGLMGNANRTIDLAEGEFMARFDADDVMPPWRIQRQVSFLEQHRHLIAVSGHNQILGTDTIDRLPTDEGAIRATMPVRNPLSQGAAMFRLGSLRASGQRYALDEPNVGEDWLFFHCLSQHGRLANLDLVCNFYRIHSGGVSAARDERYYSDTGTVMKRILNDLGIPATDREIDVHRFLRAQHRIAVDQESVSEFVAWIPELEAAYARANLDVTILRRLEAAAFDQLYYHVDPKDRKTLRLIQVHSKMSMRHRRYLVSARIRRFLRRPHGPSTPSSLLRSTDS